MILLKGVARARATYGSIIGRTGSHFVFNYFEATELRSLNHKTLKHIHSIENIAVYKSFSSSCLRISVFTEAQSLDVLYS